MASLSKLWIGLGAAFACLLLIAVIVLLLYYVMWWKMKKFSRRSSQEDETDGVVMPSSNLKKKKVCFFCWKTPSTIHHNASQGHSPPIVDFDPESGIELGGTSDVLVKASGEESVDSELMRLHNLSGPPRFLFTIKEESKEDLESDDGKSRDGRSRKVSRTRSLSDLMLDNTPFITPLASPRLKSPNQSSLSCYTGFNPLFESSAEAELNRMISSPPPKFKFLRDAEEKFCRRLKEEAEKKALQNGGARPDCDSTSRMAKEDKDSPVTSTTGKSNEREDHRHGTSPPLPRSGSS